MIHSSWSLSSRTTTHIVRAHSGARLATLVLLTSLPRVLRRVAVLRAVVVDTPQELLEDISSCPMLFEYLEVVHRVFGQFDNVREYVDGRIHPRAVDKVD
jgi:hypothetical protein